jgi:DNA polymerase-3 subunit alpha
MPFVCHCHVHDEYSPLDGTGNRNQLTYEAVRKGQTHLGFTNHGRLGGALEHVHACRHPEKFDNPVDPSKKRSKDERLHAILGMEAYWRPDRFMDLSDKEIYGKNGHNWAQHLCLHARDMNGWRTLMRLSSKSWVKREQEGGHYGKPCLDWEMIEEDHEGIIISTACINSPVAALILEGDLEGAQQWCEDAISIVGFDNFFFEIMPHDLEEQRIVNQGKIEIANAIGRPYMASGDVHMPYKKWADTQRVVMMAATRQSLADQEAKKEAGEEVYGEKAIDTLFLSSGDEMRDMFREHHSYLTDDQIEESLNNTEVFAHRFKGYVIGKTTKLPKISKTEKDAEKTIREWIADGRAKRAAAWKAEKVDANEILRRHKIYDERNEYEFGVLKRKGVLDYFILVGDAVRWAKSTLPLPERDKHGELYYPKDKKKRPIRVGLGRGSAAGSLISYDIGITAIDPIAWGLLFERFLNPDRVGLPDIDLDFETEVPVLQVIQNGRPVWLDGRECVKEYFKRVYGHDHVADIIAYQTFAPRAVIRAVSDTQDVPFGVIKSVTDSIGDTERDLEKIAKDNAVVAKFKEKNPVIWEHCIRLEDQILRDSRHAGGVLITPKPTNHYMPTQLGNDDKSVVTAWSDRADFPVVSDYGFVKMDILGVKGLAKQQLACDLIEEHYGVHFEPNELPVLRDPYATDQKVIDAFVHGLTLLVFQFGGRGITQLLRHIKPNNAIDIAVANALYRPGPIKIAFQYGDRKNGKIPDTEWYWHDSLEPLLGQTLGLIAFQEQVMEIVKVLGNFTGGEADSMRKAISKLYRLPGDKAREFMEQWRSKWINGCMSNGLTEQVAILIWEKILEFAGYGFNKSHSASYALQAYQDMHIKVNYPLALYAAGLTIEKKAKREEQEEFLRGVLREARVLGVEALPPSVNTSDRGWTIDGDKIRYGLVSVSGMGGKAAEDIKKQRPFKDFDQYMTKMPSDFPVNASVALAKGGAFDELIDRKVILGKIRKHADNVLKLKVVMDCGCKKTKQIKLTKKLDEELSNDGYYGEGDPLERKMEVATDVLLDELECKKHPGAKWDRFDEEDPNFTVLEYIKAHGDWPDEEDAAIDEPTDEEIINDEIFVLHTSLSQGNVASEYHAYIDSKVYGEEDFDALPAKPKRQGKKHGTYCQCEGCRAAHCVVGGEITNVKVIRTKKGDPMAFVDVAFGVNQWSCTFFNWAYLKFKEQLERPGAYLLAGHKDDRNQVLVYDMLDVIHAAEEEGWKPDPKVVPLHAKVRTPRIKSKSVKPKSDRKVIKIKRRVA